MEPLIRVGARSNPQKMGTFSSPKQGNTSTEDRRLDVCLRLSTGNGMAHIEDCWQ